MCKTFNTIGSLTTLKTQLEKHNIHDFKSVNEVIDFQTSFINRRQQLILHHEKLIEQERNMLKIDLQHLDVEIEMQRMQSEQRLKAEVDKLKQKLYLLSNEKPSIFYQELIKYITLYIYKSQIKWKEYNFEKTVRKSIGKLSQIILAKKNHYQFINSQFRVAVTQSCQHTLSLLEKKKATIDTLSPIIYGALGEQKVVKTLEVLSDEYFLINNFTVSFSPAIYNRKEKESIKSVQIDHILVAPSGIFLIETKNWNEKSLENTNFHSPVHQIKRTSWALFKLVNNEKGKYKLRLDNHHWGKKNLSIKSLIVFTNTKPQVEFQYVKILSLYELIGYINFFNPIYSNAETQKIADFLLSVNDKKRITIK